MNSLKTLITILLFISGALAIQYLVMPKWQEINQIRTELAAVQDTLDQTKNLVRLYDDLDARYQQVSPDDITRVTDFLPPKPDIGDLLIDMDTLVKNAGMRLDNIAFEDTAGSSVTAVAAPNSEDSSAGRNLIEPLKFSLRVSGSYEQFQTFLDSVENNLRLVDVQRIGFSGKDEDSYQFNLDAQTYYQKKNVF